jgi:2-oxoglutarate ferredoxin oxidoreductase subunit gamma
MSTQKLFFAGSGGQGILLMGQMIAYGAMSQGLETTFLPSYGPEMRGGTANCTVVVSDKAISCPLIFEADAVVVMNPPSLTKFEPLVKPGGKMLINTSMVTERPTRTDIDVIEVPCLELAEELGNRRTQNVIMFGALVSETNVISPEGVDYALHKVFSGKKAKLLDLNTKAAGYFKEKCGK